MILEKLSASNFRNIKKCDIEFCRGVNLLLGQNAQGKTNALECIYLFARGRSFRFASDSDLVRFGQTGFDCSVTFSDSKRRHTLSYVYERGKRTRKHNGAPVDRTSEMLGYFRAVLFSPDHLQLVKGNPEIRRSFLNIALSQTDVSYLLEYTAYQKVLDSRNSLLKDASKGRYFDRDELSVWTEKLCASSALLYKKRKDYIEKLKAYAPLFMSEISDSGESLSLEYDSEIKGESTEELKKSYAAAFEEAYRRECAAGCSLFGVHRDDIKLKINGIEARRYASQGQQRSVVLALKMAEGETCREICGQSPVYLFDDVLSELDGRRRQYVLTGSADRQYIITSCEDIVGSEINRIEVKDGIYVPSHR